MDLLETVLRTCEAEEYLENFKEYGIDCFTLKILEDEDLIFVGIDKDEKRKSLLEHISNLQTPAEKKINRVIDETYILLVLNQMSLQMHRHYANLIYAYKREDTDLCNIELTPAVHCLEGVLSSFEEELNRFKAQAIGKKKRKKFHVLFPVLIITGFAFYMCRKSIVSN